MSNQKFQKPSDAIFEGHPYSTFGKFEAEWLVAAIPRLLEENGDSWESTFYTPVKYPVRHAFEWLRSLRSLRLEPEWDGQYLWSMEFLVREGYIEPAEYDGGLPNWLMTSVLGSKYPYHNINFRATQKLVDWYESYLSDKTE